MSSYEHADGTQPRAAILQFPRKRGRPRTGRPKKDTGTPELIMKRLRQETAEALDLCLERGIITPEQHWCGIHLRWLYTLRYGAPGVRAVDPTHLGGMEIRPDDPEWRNAREKEYTEALQLLSQGGHVTLLMNLCVYNERPRFLSKPLSKSDGYTKSTLRALEKTRAGLDVLVKYWRQ